MELSWQAKHNIVIQNGAELKYAIFVHIFSPYFCCPLWQIIPFNDSSYMSYKGILETIEFDLAAPNSHAKMCKVTNTLYMTVAMFTAKKFVDILVCYLKSRALKADFHISYIQQPKVVTFFLYTF